MNRLILIGNGFDLAHGMRTSYNNFIMSYLTNCFQEALTNNSYEDDLISINRSFFVEFKIGRAADIPSFIAIYYEKGFGDLLNNRVLDIGSTQYQPYFRVQVKSHFFKHLATSCSHATWVDIENEYYEELKKILVQKNYPDKVKVLNDLNKSMKNIIARLEHYLQSLPIPDLQKQYIKILKEDILHDDVVTINLNDDLQPDTTRILNFNYTRTIENYFDGKDEALRYGFEVNYIHGQLGNPQNPLIFGFGDELDENYLLMEHEKTKGFLEYIKSFWYFKTSNYHDLIRFIDASDFQVFILGHSCGLSDRTMLNMIFEHDKCKSIKIFYHGDTAKNNFTSLTQEISKHFKNKGVMRKKIVPFNKSLPMPQVSK